MNNPYNCKACNHAYASSLTGLKCMNYECPEYFKPVEDERAARAAERLITDA